MIHTCCFTVNRKATLYNQDVVRLYIELSLLPDLSKSDSGEGGGGLCGVERTAAWVGAPWSLRTPKSFLDQWAEYLQVWSMGKFNGVHSYYGSGDDAQTRAGGQTSESF